MSAALTILPQSSKDDTNPVAQANRSPISEIPTDVLFAIFETVIMAWDAVHMMPAILCRVCTRWRDCVGKSPTLWSTIRAYEVLDLTTVLLEHEIRRVKTFLRRSQECPLTIDIAIYSYIRHEGDDNAWADSLLIFHDKLQELSQALGQHAHRIKSLTLVIDEYQSTTSILSGLTNVAMPMLTHWDVRNIYDQSWDLDEDLEDEEVNAHSVLLHPPETPEERWMTMCPNLQFVSLHAVPHHWPRFSPTNLVTLEIRMIQEKWRPSASALERILRTNAHSLERLMLSVALPPSISLGEPIALPNLEWIELGFTHTAEVVTLINAIEVPSLRVLILCDSRREHLPINLRDNRAFDDGIANLFAVLVSRFPLHQLTDMTLRHIALCPMPCASAEVLSQCMEIAIDFFCRLVNLNFLAISNSDVVTLDALNRVQIRVESQRPKFPVPKLSFLQITDTGYKILQFFLRQRLSDTKVYKPLKALVITMPNSWYQMSKWDTLNVKRLAQEVFPLVSRLTSDAERQLAAT
ncbi:hypothetical protein C0992_009625 [Termitomyces sp. T32_za158]|nr:hypothetical protein C0992_009625 [Termitomyces sp. T32_za158]